ncbi:putative peptidase [Atlantibacter hermannii]|nr:putative peptidase [Atlantibacter hermannii]
MRWQGRRGSDNVEDRRSDSRGPMMGGGGFRLPGGKGGVVLLVIVVIASFYGVDLTSLLTGGQPVSQQSSRSVSPNEDEAAKFTSVILATTEDTWGANFRAPGAHLSTAQTGHVSRRDAYRLWHRPVGDGAVLLSGGQYRLY